MNSAPRKLQHPQPPLRCPHPRAQSFLQWSTLYAIPASTLVFGMHSALTSRKPQVPLIILPFVVLGVCLCAKCCQFDKPNTSKPKFEDDKNDKSRKRRLPASAGTLSAFHDALPSFTFSGVGCPLEVHAHAELWASETSRRRSSVCLFPLFRYISMGFVFSFELLVFRSGTSCSEASARV